MCLFKFTTYVGFHSVNLRMRWMYSIYLKKYAGGRPLCTYVNIYIYINMISWYVFHFSGSDIMENHCRCHWFMNIWHFKHLKFKPLSTRHPQVRNLHVAADWGHRPFNHLDWCWSTLYQCASNFCHSGEKKTHLPPQKLSKIVMDPKNYGNFM